MAKMIVVTDGWISNATVVSEDSEAEAPASNLQTINPSEIWQTPDVTSQHVQFQRSGAATFIDTVALLYTNATEFAQWRVRGWNTGVGQTLGSPGFDSGSFDMWPSDGLETYDSVPAIYRHPTSVAVTNIQIDLDDSSNPDGYFRAGRLMVSDAFEPSRNFSKEAGYGVGYVDDSELVEVVQGTPKVLERPVYFYGQLTMDAQTAEDAHAWNELARLYGSKRPVFIAFDHAGDWIQFPVDAMGYVIMSFARPPLQSTRLHQRWRVPLTMREFS